MNPIYDQVKMTPVPMTTRWIRFFMGFLLAISFLNLTPSVYGADPSKIYFVPLPEEQIRVSGATIEQSGDTIHTIVSISVVAGSTTIYYDHWEDGYEADLSNPAQASTQKWTHNAGDILTLENDVPANPRGTAVRYDGGDRIGSTNGIAVTRAGWPTSPGTVFAGAVEVFDSSKWAIHYVLPVGEDSPGSSSFQYIGLSVMAAEDSTTVEIDTDADGLVDISQVLNTGESYLVNGGLQVGAEVSASAPVQVDLITGDIGARFEGRWFTLIPDTQWSDSYYNPVGTTVNDDPAYTVLYNPDTSPLTVNYETYPSGSGSFSVPAGGTYEFQMPTNSGAHFYSGGSPFFAICLMDYDGSTHDWGFTLLPESALTTVAAVGWGPGSSNLSENGSPVWVTPTANTRIYVDYDGDQTSGSLQDPNGLWYDVHYDLTALQSQRVFDNADNNQTGMRLYTVDGTLITAAWGQDPDNAGTASPYLDLGTTVLPVASIIVQKDGVLANDINANGLVDPGDTLQYTIIINNTGTQTLNDIVVTDDMDPNTNYVPGTSTLFGSPVADEPAPDTPFPFDEDGFTFSNLTPGNTAAIIYQAQVAHPLPEGTTSVTNSVSVETDIETLDDSVQTPVYGGTRNIKQLYLSEPGQSLDRVDPEATGDTTTAISMEISSSGETPSIEFTQTPIMCENFVLPSGSLIGVTAYIDVTSGSMPDSPAITSTLQHDGTTITTLTNPTQTPVGPLSNEDVRDDFNTIAYTGNNGSVDWLDAWAENDPAGGGSGASGGYVSVENGRLKFDWVYANAENAIRYADLSYAATAELSFDWETVGLDTGDTISVIIYNPNTGLDVELDAFTGTQTGSESYDITAYISDNTGIRFENRSVNWENGERAYFDNVQIAYQLPGSPFRLEWSGILLSEAIVPDGEQIELEITTAEPRVSFEILYDSNTYPSVVKMETETVIRVDSLEVYDAASPGGTLVEPGTVGQTVYIRTAVSDPFGPDDITSLDLSITDACDPVGNTNITLNDTYVVDKGTCSKTYELAYLVPNCGGTYTVVATANEGTEGVTDSKMTTFEVVPNLDSFEADYITEDNLYYRDPAGTGQVEDIIYTGSLGFLINTGYVVAYYDGQGSLVHTDTSASADENGFLRSTNPNSEDDVAYGTWTAVVMPDGTTPQADLVAQLAHTSTIVDDTFEVVSWSTATLMDATGTPVSQYQMPGGSGMAYIRVVDADQNTDPDRIETINVVISDWLTEDSETITLYETGPDTGIFANNASGSLYGQPLSSSTGTEENDGTLNTIGGSSIHVGYQDPNDKSDTSGDDSTIPSLAIIGSFGAYTKSGRVMVEWQTTSENGTIGFYLERLNEKRGKYKRINRKLLPGMLVSPQGGTYRYQDKAAQSGSTYTYRLVEKEVAGGQKVYGPYTVTIDDPEFKSQYLLSESTDSVSVDGAILEREVKTRKKRLKRAVPIMEKDRHTTRKSGRLGMNISLEADGLYFISIEYIAHSLNISLTKAKRWIKSRRFALTYQGLPVAWRSAPNGDGLYFYGESIDSHYTGINVYQLTRGKGKMITSLRGQGPEIMPMPDGFTTQTHAEIDQWALTALFDDPNEDYWAWDYLIAGYDELDQKRFSIEAPGLIAGTVSDLTVHLKGGQDADHRVLVDVNGTTVGDVQFSGTISKSATLNIPAGILTEGENTVTLTALEPPVETSIVYIDSFNLSYEKAFVAMKDQLVFKAEGRNVITVDGFSNDIIQVFDITDPLKVIQIQSVTIEEAGDGTFSVSLWVDNPDGRFLALASPAITVLSADALTTFTPRYLKQTDHSVDYLVIAPEELKDGAQDLADYRQGRGYDTMVVLLPDIYDAFNFGIANPEAVRDFLQYAWHNWRKAPRYVVRVGDGSNDYKDIQGTGDTLMPPLMVTTPWGLSASENLLADVDGSNDGVPEIMIGLLPAENSEALDAMIDKIIAYEASVGDWKNNVMMVADNPDGGGNFPAESDAVAALVPDEFKTESIYLGDLGIFKAKQTLAEGFEDGAFLMNYFGHAGMDRLASEGLWTLSDVAKMTNQDRLPILLGMTCVAGRFEIPGYDAIGEAMVVRPDGGVVAAWVPTGLSLNSLARILDEEFFKAVFIDNETVLGDAILSAMNAFKAKHTIGRSFMLDIYTLIGDPALKLR